MRRGRAVCRAGSLCRRRYRDRFLQGLKQIHNRGGLKLEGEFASLKETAAFKQFIDKLAKVSWGLNLQPPPKVDCDSATLLKYLARYLTGGPLSTKRLISAFISVSGFSP